MQIHRVLVSGASGLIGSSLVRALSGRSIHTVKLIREPAAGQDSTVLWNPYSPDPIKDLQRLNNLDAAVHLSGANVAGQRWTAAYKREIVASRVEPTKALATLLARLPAKPRVLVCASAIGIYGDRGAEILTEDSASGSRFLAETCKAWEAAAQPARDAGIRVVHARFGVVLSSKGGMVAKLRPIFRFGLGGKLASGRQWLSWVSLNDAVRILLRALEDDAMAGPVNVVSPQPATNADFTRAFAGAVHRPAVAPVPAFALRLFAGEFADEALLASERVVPLRLAEAGFDFEDPELEPTLRAMLGS